MFRKLLKNKSGISLLELMVAVAIFSVVILSAAQIFKAVIVGQRAAIAAQNLQESMRYAFETMAKEMRAAKPSDGECAGLFSPQPDSENKIFNKTSNSAGEILYFKNDQDLCTAYYLKDGIMMVARGAQIASTTSSHITISNLKFEIADDVIGSPHSIQPQVTMRMNIEAKGNELEKQSMELQTTISSRYYE